MRDALGAPALRTVGDADDGRVSSRRATMSGRQSRQTALLWATILASDNFRMAIQESISIDSIYNAGRGVFLKAVSAHFSASFLRDKGSMNTGETGRRNTGGRASPR